MTIVIGLFGNRFHSEFSDEGAKCFSNDADAFANTLKSFNIPILIGAQKIDFLSKETYGLLETKPGKSKIQFCNSLFTHVVAPMITPEQLKWQVERGQQGTCSVSFFPEFAVNHQAAGILPNPLILESQVKYYVFEATGLDVKHAEKPKTPLIRIGKTTAIRMQGFEALRDALHKFFLDPRENLMSLVDTIKAVSQNSSEVPVIWPADLETPYIGSSVKKGSVLYSMLFTKLEEQGLLDSFISIDKAREIMRDQGVERTAALPDRDLAKWVSAAIQFEHAQRLNRIVLKDISDEYLHAIATISDLYSAWKRKILGPVELPAKDLNGNKEIIRIGHNQSVIDVCLAAYAALKKQERLTDILKKKGIKGSPLKETLVEELDF